MLSGILCSLFLSASHPVSYADPVGRLPTSVLDVHAPSARVTGEPGNVIYTYRACSPRDTSDLRARIVNVAAQEWGFFGMSVLDLTHTRASNPDFRAAPWRRTLIAPNEAQRVATTIAGYWSSTPDSAWILETQNQSWQSNGPGSRWRSPWSAAFISWVMCESGLGDKERFQRAIAHHSYIDQAILASTQAESESAYRAFNPGEQTILPGDLLCRGSRPSYRSIAERREQLGMGARSHCDIVVAIEEQKQRILVTTLTKKMAEELSEYFIEMGIKTHYLHSEIDTLERIEILRDLRYGIYDVVVGINLLREGLDLPEVSLVAILDADKDCLLYTSPSTRDRTRSRMPSSA